MTSLATALLATCSLLGQAEGLTEPQEKMSQFGWWVGSYEGEIILVRDIADVAKKGDKAMLYGNLEWVSDKSFILTNWWMDVNGKSVMSGVLVMGWDPTEKKFKDWTFDSTGGHGTRVWKQDGGRWKVDVEITTAEGEKQTNTQFLEQLSPDLHTWSTTIVDGKQLPEPSVVTFKRVKEKTLKRTPGPSAHFKHLKGLDCVSGKWTTTATNEDGVESEVQFNVEWILNKNVQLMTVNQKSDEEAFRQFRYWDEAKQQIEGVIFSPGGHSSNLLVTVDANGIVDNAVSVRADGTKRQAVRTSVIDGDTWTVTATDRIHDGVEQDDWTLDMKRVSQ